MGSCIRRSRDTAIRRNYLMPLRHCLRSAAMKISDILSKHYEEFLAKCLNTNKAVYGGKTSEDILNDTMVTVIKHFGDRDISEEEGFEYAKKTFLMEEQFAYKKKSWPSEKLIEYTDEL